MAIFLGCCPGARAQTVRSFSNVQRPFNQFDFNYPGVSEVFEWYHAYRESLLWTVGGDVVESIRDTRFADWYSIIPFGTPGGATGFEDPAQTTLTYVPDETTYSAVSAGRGSFISNVVTFPTTAQRVDTQLFTNGTLVHTKTFRDPFDMAGRRQMLIDAVNGLDITLAAPGERGQVWALRKDGSVILTPTIQAGEDLDRQTSNMLHFDRPPNVPPFGVMLEMYASHAGIGFNDAYCKTFRAFRSRALVREDVRPAVCDVTFGNRECVSVVMGPPPMSRLPSIAHSAQFNMIPASQGGNPVPPPCCSNPFL